MYSRDLKGMGVQWISKDMAVFNLSINRLTSFFHLLLASIVFTDVIPKSK